MCLPVRSIQLSIEQRDSLAKSTAPISELLLLLLYLHVLIEFAAYRVSHGTICLPLKSIFSTFRQLTTNLKIMPLKNIPRILSPDLLYVLSCMGHGDEIVLADANFPSSSVCANGPKEVRADGHSIPVLLSGILELLPLDTYVPQPVALMDLVPSDKEKGLKTPVWDKYKQLINASEGKEISAELVERFAFYERAKKAYAVVHTGESALYGNIILKKGVIP